MCCLPFMQADLSLLCLVLEGTGENDWGKGHALLVISVLLRDVGMIKEEEMSSLYYLVSSGLA